MNLKKDHPWTVPLLAPSGISAWGMSKWLLVRMVQWLFLTISTHTVSKISLAVHHTFTSEGCLLKALYSQQPFTLLKDLILLIATTSRGYFF